MDPPIDPKADTFGLPPSLRIAVAAADPSTIERFAGCIVATQAARATGRINAIKVRTAAAPPEPNRVLLWEHPQANHFRSILYPEFQLWVHVDFAGYRRAWQRLGMPGLPADFMLDHIANRKATRLRGYLHPYIRLCPVPRIINTNAGHPLGGEGMERDYMKHVQSLPERQRRDAINKMRSLIVYADPMDLTKMLRISPGTQTLDGVRDLLALFYPA